MITATKVFSASPVDKVDSYANIYRIAPELVNVLRQMKKAHWYLLNNHKTVQEAGQRYAEIRTGFYSGVGMNAKRVDLTPDVISALRGAGMRFEHRNDAPRQGVKGNIIRIYY